jgi:hypothetical protein
MRKPHKYVENTRPQFQLMQQKIDTWLSRHYPSAQAIEFECSLDPVGLKIDVNT